MLFLLVLTLGATGFSDRILTAQVGEELALSKKVEPHERDNRNGVPQREDQRRAIARPPDDGERRNEHQEAG